MKTKKPIQNYSPEALADAVVFPVTLTAAQQKKASAQLADARDKAQRSMTENERLSLRLFQLKFQLETYFENKEFNPTLTFGYFLKQYVDLLQVKRKVFADAISIDETSLSQFINKHRIPPEYVTIRLEIHSNNAIPATYWFKLIEKQKEYELKTDTALRKRENKFVHERLAVTL